MSGKINVGTENISASLKEFESAMTEMDALFQEIRTKTSNVNGYWAGKASDSMLTVLTDFMKVFDEINAQNQKYVSFLNEVIKRYTQTEEFISKTIDESANSGLGINGSGN